MSAEQDWTACRACTYHCDVGWTRACDSLVERCPLIAAAPSLLSAAREALAAFEAEPCISDRGSGRTFNTPHCDECCCPDAETCGQLERGEIQTDAEGRCLCEHCHGDGGVRYMAKLDAICKKSQAVKQLRAAIERAGGGR